MRRFATLLALLLVGFALTFARTPRGRDAAEPLSVRLGIEAPTRRGFLDDAVLSPAQVARIARVRVSGAVDEVGAVLGRGLALDRTDAELLRQDLRRAQAAYLDATLELLADERWMRFDPSKRVPTSWGGGNSSSVVVDGRDYLEAALEAVVKPSYPDRADAAATRAFFAAREARRRAGLLARRRIVFASGGPDDFRVSCSTLRGCAVRRQLEGEPFRSTWRFAFAPEDWAGRGLQDFADVRGMPSFKAAREVRSKAAVRRPSAGASFPVASCVVPGDGWSVAGVSSTSAATGLVVTSASGAMATLTVSSPLSSPCMPAGPVPYVPGMTILPGQSVVLGSVPATLPRR